VVEKVIEECHRLERVLLISVAEEPIWLSMTRVIPQLGQKPFWSTVVTLFSTV
jgi:hypothetical protein